ncbi:MAG: hypothetical protein KBA46_02205 [Candidatus Omnitrophica bacterium]|nr:hypothetical protein [Candidatus Omnitrophota bacterium]
MKVLVVYASCGAGHFKAAEAIYETLRQRLPADDVQLEDILSHANAIFKFCYTIGYTFLATRARVFWAIGFWLTQVRWLGRFPRNLAVFLDTANTQVFSRMLIRENPDVMVATHFVPSIIAANLKRTGAISSRLITVITDFGAHPFWISPGIDQYAVASDFVKTQLVDAGVPEEKIGVWGIPIDARFTRQYDRKIVAQRNGLNPDLFTVLVMTGSFGSGPLEEIAEALHRDTQVLVVCSANVKLFDRLKKKNLSQVFAYVQVPNMQELMACADVIITKPGGLTISESLAMNLVPLFITPIPGQETYNMRELAKKGIGYRPRNVREIKACILDFKQHPEKLKAVQRKIQDFKKPHAATKICDEICQGGGGSSC